MELQVYKSEKYRRSDTRYVIFGLIMAGLITLSLASKNWIGVLVLFLTLGGYFYYSVKNSTTTILKILPTGIQIDNKIIPRNAIQGFVLEAEEKSKQIRNIVFLLRSGGHSIHTIHDKTENIGVFVQELSTYIPMTDNFSQSMREKILRKLQI